MVGPVVGPGRVALADAELATMIDVERSLRLAVWRSLIVRHGSEDPNYRDGFVIGRPRIDGRNYVVPVTKAKLPGQVLELSTAYPFVHLTQTLLIGPDVETVDVSDLGAEYTAMMLAGRLSA